MVHLNNCIFLKEVGLNSGYVVTAAHGLEKLLVYI